MPYLHHGLHHEGGGEPVGLAELQLEAEQCQVREREGKRTYLHHGLHHEGGGEPVGLAELELQTEKRQGHGGRPEDL